MPLLKTDVIFTLTRQVRTGLTRLMMNFATKDKYTKVQPVVYIPVGTRADTVSTGVMEYWLNWLTSDSIFTSVTNVQTPSEAREKFVSSFRVKNVVLTRLSVCLNHVRLRMHTNDHACTHVKDPVAHVRVWWITETR